MWVDITSDGRMVCAWFALCDRPADWVSRGPVGGGAFGMVPVCQRCADRVGIPVGERHAYALETGELS
jgi:hypothetical protein